MNGKCRFLQPMKDNGGSIPPLATNIMKKLSILTAITLSLLALVDCKPAQKCVKFHYIKTVNYDPITSTKQVNFIKVCDSLTPISR